MAKTNFSKVEGAFDDGLNKIKIQSLYQKAEEVVSPESALIRERRQQLHQALVWMRYEIKSHSKKDKSFLEQVGIDPKVCELLNREEESLEESEWRLLLENHQKLELYLKEQKKKEPSNEEILKAQKERNQKRRFNVSERWIPLK